MSRVRHEACCSSSFDEATVMLDHIRMLVFVMPEQRILVRQTSNWTLFDKKLAQDAAMTLFMLVYRA